MKFFDFKEYIEIGCISKGIFVSRPDIIFHRLVDDISDLKV